MSWIISLLVGLMRMIVTLVPLISGNPLYPIFPSLDEASIDDLLGYLEDGSVTSVDLVHAYIKRTSEVNHLLRAVREMNPDALDIARILDAERAVGHVRGPLHGIPILIKDNIATMDKMNNTAGSLALLGATVSREATVVSKLRAAGGIILGKAAMGEWAQCRSRKRSSTHGWSALSGQVYGAYYPEQDPSGSSSGSAVAVSIGLALGSLATETSGSIVNPGEKANVVGIKPTLGLTSRSMVIPISIRQDTVGPIARTVKDAAYLLSAIAGKDRYDNWTSVQPFESPRDYAKACNYLGLKKARIGIPRNGIAYFLDNTNAAVMESFEEALRIMELAGASVVDNANFPDFNFPAFSRNASIVLDTDFVAGLSEYLSLLATNPYDVHNLQDISRFTKSHPLEEYPKRDTYVWDRELARNITNESEETWLAYQANLSMGREQGVLGALDKYELDALVMPTFASFHLPAIAGLPIITVPLGFYPADTTLVKNLKGDMVTVAPNIPFGLAFIGREWSEETLISLAYAFEQRTLVGRRVKPRIAPAFQLKDLRQDILSPSYPMKMSDIHGGTTQQSVAYIVPAELSFTPHGSMITSTSTKPRSTAHDRYSSSLALPKDVPTQNSALKGASVAFNSPPRPTQLITNTYSGTNGALAASRMAGTGRVRAATDAKDDRLPSQSIRALGRSNRIVSAGVPVSNAASSTADILGSPTRSTPIRQQSPSHIAATLAAARSASVTTPEGAKRVNSRRPSPLRLESFERLSNTRPDATPIAATNTLVELFESKKDSRSSLKGDAHTKKYAPSIVSPNPLRPSITTQDASSRFVLDRALNLQAGNEGNVKLVTTTEEQQPRKVKILTTTSISSADSSNAQLQATSQKIAPVLPPPRRSSRPSVIGQLSETQEAVLVGRLDGNSSASSASSYTSAFDAIQANPQTQNDQSKFDKHSQRSSHPLSAFYTANGDPKMQHLQFPNRISSQDNVRRRTSDSTLDTKLARLRFTPAQLNADSLANAIVASSLASSRASSPTKPAPPLPRRHSKQYFLFRQNHQTQDQLPSRTPSPAKGMRQTMRAPARSDDEDDLHKRSHHPFKKHPNKHHEGDRKRWRDQITERERKRYEGVWAVNRGLLLQPDEPQDAVCNLVVRDLWRRSNLSNNVLGELWDLVDSEGAGRLSKDEFVVGMWLIDQCLRGRKLPVRVSDSVWASVRRLDGIKVPRNRR